MDKRVFITVLVCVGIMLVWQTFIMPPQKKVAPASQPIATQQNVPQKKAEPVAVGAAPATQAASAAAAVEERTIQLQTPDYTAKLSNIGASLTSFTLSAYKEAHDPKAEKQPVNLVQREAVRAVSVELGGEPFPFAPGEQRATEVVFSGEHGGIRALAVWTVGKDYVLSLRTRFDNTTAGTLSINPRLAIRGVFNERAVKDKSFLAPPPDVLTPLMSVDNSMYRHTQGKKDAPEKTANAQWAGIDRQYFLIAAAPKMPVTAADFTEARVAGTNDFVELGTVLDQGAVTLEAGKSTELAYTVFAGPKVAKLLKAPAVGFEDAIDYTVLGMPLGFLSRPMLWILNQAQKIVGSYGWAILILTLVVKLLLLPVTQKSFESMQVMKELKPALDKIKERYPNDRERQGMETMRLYKERNVNPFLSGCLPALLQMPVYFALWRTLWAAVELYQQEFLWFKDLTQPDPYFIVPALLGVTMFFQQKLSPPAGDPQQQKIMLYMMPPLMTSFMLFLPAGLVFYIFINTILTILQQTYISKKFAKKPIPSAA